MLSHRGRAQRLPAQRNETGETLIEVLISVVLLGTVVAAVLGGLFTIVRTSDSNKEKTRTGVAVQTFAEAIKQPVADLAPSLANLAYIPCRATSATTKTATGVQPAAATSATTMAGLYKTQLDATTVNASLPTNYTYELKVEYWSGATAAGSAAAPASAGTFSSTCPTTLPDTTAGDFVRDQGLQRITVTIKNNRSGARAVTESLVVTKRDARCPQTVGAFPNLDQGPC